MKYFAHIILIGLLCVLLHFPCLAGDTPTPELLNGMVAQMLMIGFREAKVDAETPIVKYIEGGYVANVILFDVDVSAPTFPARNIRSPKQISSLIASLQQAARQQSALRHDVWIAVDQEGGMVQRLNLANGFAQKYPSAKELGAMEVSASWRTARAMGDELHSYGFDLNFAPVADLDIDENSPAIGAKQRSFGRNPEAVFKRIQAFGNGLADSGVIPCLKHFPGHGSATHDTHAGFTDVTATWTPAELEPYKKAIAADWPGAIMTAHVFNKELDDTFPASLSHAVTTGLLRKQLGWEGVVITDDLHMGAVAKQYSLRDTICLAINAGADILVFSNNSRDIPYDPDLAPKAHGIILDLIAEGKISGERIAESWKRIRNLKTGALELRLRANPDKSLSE